jgi:hypothetical protein
MRPTLNNPYRTAGVLIGTSAKDQERQIRRLRQYIDAEQDPPKDYSFPVLGQINRTIEEINDAASKLSVDGDKMSAALFWFYNGNPITDEPALDALSDGELDQAISIWSRLISKGDISKRNASAYSNLATLYLSGNLQEKQSFDSLLSEGIALKIKYLESDFVDDLIKFSTDETFKTNKKELQINFLRHIFPEIEKKGDSWTSELIDLLLKLEFSAKSDFLNGIVRKPIELLEHKIEECRSKRKANSANSLKAANKLQSDSKELLHRVKSILGPSNIMYSKIADQLALELVTCGRVYFDLNEDSADDPSENVMKLYKKAQKIAVGQIAIQEINEKISDLEEWVDEKPDRERRYGVIADLHFVKLRLDNYMEEPDTIQNAKVLVDYCKPKLNNIKEALGSTDDLYLQMSGAVARCALGALISVVNSAQRNFSPSNISSYTNLRTVIVSALEVSKSIGSLDMDHDQREHFDTNLKTLKSLAIQLTDLGPSSSPTPPIRSATPPQYHTSQGSGYSETDSYFIDNAWWILGLIFAFVFGIIADASRGGTEFGGGFFTGFTIGAIIGWIIKQNK